MTLTYQQIWDQYPQVEFQRKFFIKRLKTDGIYESAFTEITQGLKDGGIRSLSKSLPNNSWQFGSIIITNIRLQILSAFQEFANEQDPNSIFSGFIRHRSIVRIVDALVDKYTDPDIPVNAEVTTFEGLIDSNTATTEQGYEEITALDFLTIADEINVNELSLVQTTLNALVFELMNRDEFTKFFIVSSSTTFINAGYNASSIDTSQYDGTILEMLQDLAKGHSIFFVDPDDNTFHFKSADPTTSVQYQFLERNNRKISISSYREGVDRQITNWYWKDTAISSVVSPVPINPKPNTFEIKGITNATQRQNTLNTVLTKTQLAKPYFKLVIPYFPIIKLLDKVQVQSFGSAPSDAVRWGMFLFTEKATADPATAPRWRKPAGIKIAANRNWTVRAISHDSQLRTNLELEEILLT